MNNNGWGDRFENDNEPDYPYKRDRRGFNVYGGAWIAPGAKITAGHQRVRRPSTGETNVSSYALFAFERSYPNVGELTVFNMLKRVEDDIADDLFQWLHGRFRDAGMTPIPDPLGLPNSWVNKLSLTFEHRGHAGVNSENKLIYEVLRQREQLTADRTGRKIAQHTRRLGLINKLDWLWPLGNGLQLRPRVKHELFLDDTPFNTEWLLNDRVFERKEWVGLASLRLDIPVLRHSRVIVGLEQVIFRDFVVMGLGSSLVGPTGVFNLSMAYIWADEVRSFAMATCTNALKLIEDMDARSRRLVFLALILALLIGTLGSFWMIFHVAYRYGGVNLDYCQMLTLGLWLIIDYFTGHTGNFLFSW